MMGTRESLVIVTASASLLAGVASAVYDGHWWLSATKYERTGFIAGYIDCSVYDAGRSGLRRVAWNLLAPKITEYYSVRTSRMDASVALVIGKLSPEGEQPARGGGEEYPEKHGVFDGLYWFQVEPLHRHGFVKGYLECNRLNASVVGHFSQSAESYVSRISQWYGLTANDTLDEERSKEKIADVVGRMKD